MDDSQVYIELSDSPMPKNPLFNIKQGETYSNSSPSALTILETLKIIATTGGIMVLARVVSSVGGFANNTMMTYGVDDIEKQQDILASGALIGTLQIFTLAIPAVWLSGFGNMIGKVFKDNLNNEDKEKIRTLYQQSLLLSCFFSIPPFLIQFFSGNIFKILGQPEKLSNMAQVYYSKFSLGVLPYLFLCCQQTFYIGIKKPWYAFGSALMYTGLTVSIAYPLIISKNQGYDGLGLASTLAYYSTVLATVIWHFIIKDFREYKLYEFSCKTLPTKEELGNFLWNGGKFALQIGLELGTDLVMAILIGQRKHSELDATQVALQYFYLILVPLANAVNAISFAISQQINNLNNAKKLKNVTLGLAAFIPVVFLLVSIVFPKELIKPFLSDDGTKVNETIELAKELLWTAIGTLCMAIPRLTQGAYIRGLTGETTVALKAGILSNCITLSLGTLISQLTSINAKGFFLAKLGGEIAAMSSLICKANNIGQDKKSENTGILASCMSFFKPSCCDKTDKNKHLLPNNRNILAPS